MLKTIFIIVYSAFIQVILKPFARVAAIFSDRVKVQISERDQVSSSANLVRLAEARRNYLKCTIFFCSSAGEYEQAKPVISRLSREGEFCHVFFFSVSGVKFAKAKGDQLSFCLTPWETVWEWGGMLSALSPNRAVIIRHELWPAFISSVSKWCELLLINAVPPSMYGRESVIKSLISTKWKKFLLRWGNAKVLTVDEDGRKFFVDDMQYSSDLVVQIGDTKYDRAVEQVRERLSSDENALLNNLKSHWSDHSAPILILGSAHLPDLEIVLQALKLETTPKMRLLAVPHDIDFGNIAKFINEIEKSGFSYELFSEINLSSSKSISQDVVIVDSIGKLSKLYSIADLAYIGGAVHSKIHNVLEPAVFGLPLTSGANFKNSQEAKLLADRGLLMAVKSAPQLSKVWNDQIKSREQRKSKMLEAIQSLCGASDKILTLMKVN